MRRSNADGYTYAPSVSQVLVDEESEMLTEELRTKITRLRGLAIDLGTEVKYHNKFLDDVSGDFEHSRGFLGKTMSRVMRLGRGGHNYHILILLLFCVIIVVLMWFILKFR